MGQLAYANKGPDTNASMFYVVLGPCQNLDGKNQVFGELMEGHHVLFALERQGTASGEPLTEITVDDCGVLEPEPDAPELSATASRRLAAIERITDPAAIIRDTSSSVRPDGLLEGEDAAPAALPAPAAAEEAAAGAEGAAAEEARASPGSGEDPKR